MKCESKVLLSVVAIAPTFFFISRFPYFPAKANCDDKIVCLINALSSISQEKIGDFQKENKKTGVTYSSICTPDDFNF